MKKTLYFIAIFLLLTIICEGQKFMYHNTVGVTKNNKKIGVWEYYTQDKKIVRIENYLDGILDGQLTNYYENGYKSEIFTYKLGKVTGLYISYFENGRTKSKGLYIDSLEQDDWKYFYNSHLLILFRPYHRQ